MIFYGIKFSSVSKLVIQWFYTLYHDSCVKITFFFFLIFHVIFMPKHTALKLHTTTSAVGLQLNCRHNSTNSKLKFNVVSTCRNHTDHCQKSVGHVQMRMAMWNLVHLQCIEIILSLSTLRLFVCARSKISLKWLYLKSELTMLHTCFLMTIYSTCTRCILTELSFICGVV